MLELRRRKYGDAADEWPPGYTPTEMVEKRKAEVEKLFAMIEAPSPPDSVSLQFRGRSQPCAFLPSVSVAGVRMCCAGAQAGEEAAAQGYGGGEQAQEEPEGDSKSRPPVLTA